MKTWPLQKLLEWGQQAAETRGLWRGVSYTLTGIGLIFAIAIFVYYGEQLQALSWRTYASAALLTFVPHWVSFVFQLLVWMRLMSFHHAIGWRDVEIFSRMVLLRSIPGGIWQWLGRAAMYRTLTSVPSQVIVGANFTEWALLVLVAVGVHAGSYTGSGGWGLVMVVVLLVALGVAIRWQPASRPLASRLAESGLWITLYGVAWFLGGWIIDLFVTASGSNALGLMNATRAWTLAGGLGLLTNIIPLGFFVREISLTMLLEPYVPPAVALLAALMIRVLFTLADTVWGLLGWTLSRAFQSRIPFPPEPLSEKLKPEKSPEEHQ